MNDLDLARLPVEKVFSENINRSMQVPSSITLGNSVASSDENIRRLSAKTPFEQMKAPKVISPYGGESDNSDGNTAATMIFSPERDLRKKSAWPVVGGSSGSVKNLQMRAPARRIRADSRDIESHSHINQAHNQPSMMRSISAIEAVSSMADELTDLDEQLLRDLDKTAENEKIRKQIFKINRKLLTHEKQMAAMQQRVTLISAFFGSICLGVLMFQLRRP